MDPRINTYATSSSWSHRGDFCTPLASSAQTADDMAPNVDSFDSGTLHSGTSYGSLPSKRKNTFRSGFSSLRKSAKKIFKNKNKSQDTEFEYKEGVPVLPEPRQASETFRVSIADVAARFEDEFAASTRTDPSEYTPADFEEISEVSPIAPSPNAQFTGPIVPHTLLEDDEPGPFPHTDIIHGYPSLIVVTPPESVHACPTPPYTPPSTPPTVPLKSEHEPSDFEEALKDIASQPVAFSTPGYYSQYLYGAVGYFKSIAFAVASVGIYVVALPWACVVLGIRGFTGRRSNSI